MNAVRAVLRFLARSGKRIAITIAGFAVLIVGLVMLLTPGPGLLVIAGGLAILSLEYAWAGILLEKARRRAKQAAEKASRKVKRRKRRGAIAATEVRGSDGAGREGGAARPPDPA